MKAVAELKCPECGSTKIIHDYDSGETVCSSCGLVLEGYLLDEGPEWRAFDLSEKAGRSRVGMPEQYSVHDKGLMTTITRIDYDAFGRKLPEPARYQMYRLRKWQIRSRASGSINRNLSQAMTELDRICGRLQIPQQVKEVAAVIYRKALEADLVRGRTITALVAASLYAACRSGGLPRTVKEVAEACYGGGREAIKEVTRCYRLLIKHLNLKVPIPDPITCLSKIAEPLKIDGKVQGRAVELLRMARKKRELLGKEPMGMAAAALYVACLEFGVDVAQRQIADAAGVTEVTVRNRYKSLLKSLKLKCPRRVYKRKKALPVLEEPKASAAVLRLNPA